VIIDTIELKNYRSYSEKRLELSPGTNVFWGNNAQGKTNILEAVYLSAIGRSFRTRKDAELVKMGQEFAMVTVEASLKERKKKINIVLSEKGKKQVKINDIKQQKLSALFGNILIVLFSPETLDFVKGDPGERRKNFDLLISQLNPGYLYVLQEYYKILEQKNNLLKTKRERLPSLEADIWDEKLAIANVKIKKIREDNIQKILPLFRDYHSQMSEKKEVVELVYKTQIPEKEEDCLKLIQSKREKDIFRGFTSIGIHRDDYLMSINELPLGNFGSQGQIRTAVLALKLAEKDLVFQEKGEMPVLLLDDVMSELDRERREFLYEKLKNCQVLITCTDELTGKEVKSFYIEKNV